MFGFYNMENFGQKRMWISQMDNAASNRSAISIHTAVFCAFKLVSALDAVKKGWMRDFNIYGHAILNSFYYVLVRSLFSSCVKTAL